MSLAVQAQIRRNAEELRAYLEDLRDWEQSFDKFSGTPQPKQPARSQVFPQEQKQEPDRQERGQAEGHTAGAFPSEKPEAPQSLELSQDVSTPSVPAIAKSRKKYARDLNTLPDYYKAWDAYNPDAEEECSASEGPQKKPPSQKPAEPKTSSRIARGTRQESHASAKDHGGARMRICASRVPVSWNIDASATPEKGIQSREELLALKARGNACFAARKYGKAVECYTEALEQAAAQGPQNTSSGAGAGAGEVVAQIYGNRAAAFYYLKKYDNCILDCTSALQRDPQHIKALHRRGLAWGLKGETEKAEQDLQAALQILKDKSQNQQKQQEPPSEKISSKTHEEKQIICSSSVAAATDGLPSTFTGSSVAETISHDLNRIRLEAKEKETIESKRRKAALLQPLKGSECTYPGEILRPLEVQVIQPISTRGLSTQQARRLLVQQSNPEAAESAQLQQQDHNQPQDPRQQHEFVQRHVDSPSEERGANQQQPEAPLIQSEGSQQQEEEHRQQEEEHRQQEAVPQQGAAPNQQQPQVQSLLPAAPSSTAEQEEHSCSSASATSKQASRMPQTNPTLETSISPESQQKATLVDSKTDSLVPRSYAAFEVQWRSAGGPVAPSKGSLEADPCCPCGGSRAALLLRLGACGALQKTLGVCIDPEVFYQCLVVLDHAADVLLKRHADRATEKDSSAALRESCQEGCVAMGSCETGEISAIDSANENGHHAAIEGAWEADKGCASCLAADFTAVAWGMALQQLIGGQRTAVALQLGGPACRTIVESLKKKAGALSAVAADLATAKRCCEVLLLS